jgi:hypothetical protein
MPAEAASTARAFIVAADEKVLILVCMMLTGGAANPNVVASHVRRIKEEVLTKPPVVS